jgi:hypothetical protein
MAGNSGHLYQRGLAQLDAEFPDHAEKRAASSVALPQ